MESLAIARCCLGHRRRRRGRGERRPGQPSPPWQESATAPALLSPGPATSDPCRGPFPIGQPNPPDQKCPHLEALGEDNTWPEPPGARSYITDHVTIDGRSVALPADTHLSVGSEQPHPCAPDQSPLDVAVAAVFRPGEKVSWVKFTLDGVLLESRIQPEHQDALDSLLSSLAPSGPPPPEHCVTINGKVIPLPEGATIGFVIGEAPVGVEIEEPLRANIVRYGQSWLVFTDEYGLLSNSHVAPEDEPVLRPILDELAAP